MERVTPENFNAMLQRQSNDIEQAESSGIRAESMLLAYYKRTYCMLSTNGDHAQLVSLDGPFAPIQFRMNLAGLLFTLIAGGDLVWYSTTREDRLTFMLHNPNPLGGGEITQSPEAA